MAVSSALFNPTALSVIPTTVTNTNTSVATLSWYLAPSTGITLGNFGFSWTAIPEEVKFGIDQHVVTHDIIGGSKIKDMLGSNPIDITWSGFFLGTDAPDLTNSLYALCEQKQLLSLIWGTFNANVIIRKVEFTYKKHYWIEYVIRCEVLPQKTGTTLTFTGTTTATGSTSSGLAAAGDTDITNANGSIGGATTPSEAADGLNEGVGGASTPFESDFTGDSPISFT